MIELQVHDIRRAVGDDGREAAVDVAVHVRVARMGNDATVGVVAEYVAWVTHSETSGNTTHTQHVR